MHLWIVNNEKYVKMKFIVISYIFSWEFFTAIMNTVLNKALIIVYSPDNPDFKWIVIKYVLFQTYLSTNNLVINFFDIVLREWILFRD